MIKKLLFALVWSILSAPALAGDLKNSCDAMALSRDWECDGTFKSSDMQIFCQANVMMDSDQNLICPKIQSQDLSHLCTAIAQVQESQCTLIRDADMKTTCTAIEEMDSKLCASVVDADMNHFCNALAGLQDEQCALINN